MSNENISDALRQVAMIANVSTSSLGLFRTDKQASRQAEKDHSARSGASTVRVNRFAGADDKIRAIHAVQNAAGANLQRNSMAWGNSGRRLLPNANFQRFIAAHTELKDQFDKAVDDLVNNADIVLHQAKHNIGTFNVDLPTKEEIAHAFSLDYDLEPIPDARHFNQFMGDDADVTGKVNEQLRYRFEQNMKLAYDNAMQDTAGRLTKPLEHMIERMEAYDKREQEIANGKKPGREGVFYDSILENVQEVVNVFSSINVSGDARIDALNRKLAAFGKLTPDVLRKRGDVRQAAATRAREILKDLDGFVIR